MYCGKCGRWLADNDEMKFCPDCGAPIGSKDNRAFYTDAGPIKKRMPMKWYKFVIYFQLILSVLGNLYSFVKLTTGYENRPYYRIFPAMRAVDLAAAAGYLRLIVLAIVTRQALAKYKRSGPPLLYAFYTASCALTILYYICCIAVLKNFVSIRVYSHGAGTLIGFGVMLVCSVIYFKKRAEYFVN